MKKLKDFYEYYLYHVRLAVKIIFPDAPGELEKTVTWLNFTYLMLLLAFRDKIKSNFYFFLGIVVVMIIPNFLYFGKESQLRLDEKFRNLKYKRIRAWITLIIMLSVWFFAFHDL